MYWRRVEDSNPRDAFASRRFRGVRFQPLTQLSIKTKQFLRGSGCISPPNLVEIRHFLGHFVLGRQRSVARCTSSDISSSVAHPTLRFNKIFFERGTLRRKLFLKVVSLKTFGRESCYAIYLAAGRRGKKPTPHFLAP